MHAYMHVRFEMFLIIIYLWLSFKAVPTSKGQALADEYGIKFFETVSGIYLENIEIPELLCYYAHEKHYCRVQRQI